MQTVQEFTSQISTNAECVIVGKRSVNELLMVALLYERHILLEDVPGIGKTKLARSFAISVGGILTLGFFEACFSQHDISNSQAGLARRTGERVSKVFRALKV